MDHISGSFLNATGSTLAIFKAKKWSWEIKMTPTILVAYLKREATQQASNQRGVISADALHNLVMDSNQNTSGIKDLPQQPITTMSHHTATASGILGEINQTASDFHTSPHMANNQHNYAQAELHSNNHGSTTKDGQQPTDYAGSMHTPVTLSTNGTEQDVQNQGPADHAKS